MRRQAVARRRPEWLGLIVPFDAAAVADDAYYVVYPTEFSHSKLLELFRAWLLEQASAYAAPGGG